MGPNVDLLTPEQQQFLSGILGQPGLGQQAGQAFGQLTQPYSPEQYEDVFAKAVVNPAMQQYEQSVLPSIQQRFVDANAGSSSALNQALAQSAQDLTTALGSQYGQFFQNQQNRQLQGLGQLGQLGTQRTFEPLVSQEQGVLGTLLSGLGQGAGMGLKRFL